MILAVDVFYFEDKAKAVGLGFENWTDSQPKEIYSCFTHGPAPYKAGEFYKRELPSVLDLLNKIPFQKIDLILIDGYVYLNDSGKLGLGGYLYQNLGEKIPVIGVAKSKFHQNGKNVKKIFPGKSKNPLNITSAGIDLVTAAKNIESMHGNFRIPFLLKLLDQKTREVKK